MRVARGRAAVIMLRFVSQHDITIVTASDKLEYDMEDIAMFDFNITAHDMADLSAIQGDSIRTCSDCWKDSCKACQAALKKAGCTPWGARILQPTSIAPSPTTPTRDHQTRLDAPFCTVKNCCAQEAQAARRVQNNMRQKSWPCARMSRWSTKRASTIEPFPRSGTINRIMVQSITSKNVMSTCRRCRRCRRCRCRCRYDLHVSHSAKRWNPES